MTTARTGVTSLTFPAIFKGSATHNFQFLSSSFTTFHFLKGGFFCVTLVPSLNTEGHIMRHKLDTVPAKVIRTWDDDTLYATAKACTDIINSLRKRAVTDASKDALTLAQANRRN